MLSIIGEALSQTVLDAKPFVLLHNTNGSRLEPFVMPIITNGSKLKPFVMTFYKIKKKIPAGVD